MVLHGLQLRNTGVIKPPIMEEESMFTLKIKELGRDCPTIIIRSDVHKKTQLKEDTSIYRQNMKYNLSASDLRTHITDGYMGKNPRTFLNHGHICRCWEM